MHGPATRIEVIVVRPVASFRLTDPNVAKDPAEYYETLRTQCPVAYAETWGGFWMLSRYKDVHEAFLNPDVFISGEGISVPPIPQPRVIVIEQDEPEHRKYRRPMQAWFTAARMKAFEPTVREIVTECLDAFAHRGEGDLATSLAEPVPPLVVARLLGLPADNWPWFRERMTTVLFLTADGDNAGATAAVNDLREYVREHLDARRDNPADDVLSEIINITVDGEPISEDDAISVAFLTLNAAHETTVAGIGGLLYQLGRNPAIQEQLVENPDLIDNAVEESLRIEAPIPGQGRTTATEHAVDETPIPGGERVMLLLEAANRDPSVFTCPEEFRLDRQRNQHLSFGAGIHRCVGAPLARLEMRVVLEEVLRRLPSFCIEDEAAVSVEYAVSGCTFTSLPATWDASQP
jgi:cytochrome P450